MNCLVTGALGVVGSEFARAMLRDGHTVQIIDSAGEPRNVWVWEDLRRKFGDHVRLHRARLEYMSEFALSGFLELCGLVLHAAASTGIPYSVEHSADDWERNVDGSRQLFEALRHVPRPTIVLSSVKPYGLSELLPHEGETQYVLPTQNGVHEGFPLEPDEPYAASKATQSMLAMAYARSYGLPIVTFRCSNLYGPAPCHGPRHGWLTWMCIAAVLDRPIEIQGSGKQTRDPLFTTDVTSAVLSGLVHIETVQGQVYNVGGGKQNLISVNEAVSAIEKRLGRSLTLIPAKGRDHEDMLFVTDFSKFASATGWRPRVDVEWGIQQILEWAQQHRDELAHIYS